MLMISIIYTIVLGLVIYGYEKTRKAARKQIQSVIAENIELGMKINHFRNQLSNKQLIINALREDLEDLQIEMNFREITFNFQNSAIKSLNNIIENQKLLIDSKESDIKILKRGLYYSPEYDILVPMCDLTYVGEFDKGTK